MTGGGPGSRTLNESLLRVVSRRLGELTLVETVAVFPRAKPESVVARFDGQYYPEEVRHAELEIRAYTNDDFYVTYRKQWAGDSWMCRWDRHENAHNSRDHFHEPPRAETEDAVDRSFPADFLGVLELVLTATDDRLGEVWDEIGDG